MEQLTPEQTKDLKDVLCIIDTIRMDLGFSYTHDADIETELLEVQEELETYIKEWEYISLLED